MTNNSKFATPLWTKKDPFIRLIQSSAAICALLLLLLLCQSCSSEKEDTVPPPEPPESEIIKKIDGRSVKYGDPSPIALDINEDGQIDFTVFTELTANEQGDHLYVGINPIGLNLIKSGAPNDNMFLNMGFLVAETPLSSIDFSLKPTETWTDNHSALLVRHTHNNGSLSYEGQWNEDEKAVAIQFYSEGKYRLGWLKLKFDKETEVTTLTEFAYQNISGAPIDLD